MACTSGISARLSWVLAALTATASGRPVASVSTCSLEPGLPRSTGFGPVNGPLFRAHAGRIHHRTGPVDRRLLTEPIQHRPVQPPPQPGLSPGHEPPVRGRRRHADLRGQLPPGAAGPQHVDDRGEHRPVLDAASTATLWALALWRDQRFDDLP